MKALFIGVVTLFLVVGMNNDAQAEARRDSETCPPTPHSAGRYAAAFERFKAVHGRVMTAMEIKRWQARCGCGSGWVAGGYCYQWGGR
jgi:hypothetical protein